MQTKYLKICFYEKSIAFALESTFTKKNFLLISVWKVVQVSTKEISRCEKIKLISFSEKEGCCLMAHKKIRAYVQKEDGLYCDDVVFIKIAIEYKQKEVSTLTQNNGNGISVQTNHSHVL